MKPLWKEDWKQAFPAGAVSEDSGEFLNTARERGWKAALEGKKEYTSLRSTARNRISWKYLLPIESSWEAVDIGAGTGGIACQLECGMTAIDSDQANVEFMKIRAGQEKLPHFQAIEADAVSLPLPSDKYDLVSMVGVLEWVALGHTAEPREVQLEALREVNRVLKPGGYFYLGIENRDFIGYYLDTVEPHTNLKFVSLLNREKANQVSLDRRELPYREYTYTSDEMVALLIKAGFSDIQPYWLHPNYVLTNYFIPLDEGAVRYFVDELLNPWELEGSILPIYRFYRLMEPEFIMKHIGHLGFIARKGNYA